MADHEETTIVATETNRSAHADDGYEPEIHRASHATDDAAPRRVTVVVEGMGAIQATTDERILVALERARGFGRICAAKRDLPVGCRRGGCGVCRIRVLSGSYRTGPMSRDHVSASDEAEGVALACAVWALGDLTVRFEPSNLRKSTGRMADLPSGGNRKWPT